MFFRVKSCLQISTSQNIIFLWDYKELLKKKKKDLNNPDNHGGVITHLEPDILESEVKWALGSIIANKVSGGDLIPFELFHVLNNDAIKVLPSICQQIWQTQQGPKDKKQSVFIPIPKKINAIECSNYFSIALISHARKSCSKFSKTGFNST